MTKSRRMILLVGVALSGCATEAAFSPHFRDNSTDDLRGVLSRAGAPASPAVVNATGKPVAYAVVTAPEKRLVAVELDGGKTLWSQPAEVASRIYVGKELIVAREGQDLVSRDPSSGALLWRSPIDGKLVGAAVDGGQVYYAAHGSEGRRSGVAVALDAKSGREVWRRPAKGSLGAPVARSGLVFFPFMTQWLAILEGQTGIEIARVRSTDEQVNYARSLPEGIFYGGDGIFALDDRSTNGSRKASSYGVSKFPGDFIRPVYAFDGYSPAQASYSAVDRNRVLWRAKSGGGRIIFADDQTILHAYRFLFGVKAADGGLRWAYAHPRVDLVASEHAGTALWLCAQDGTIEALDPETGSLVSTLHLEGTGLKILGATFDAEGYRPKGEGKGPKTTLAEALTQIVWDNDRRFNAVKMFAVEALSRLPGEEVGRELVKIVSREGLDRQVYGKAGEALASRKDTDSLPLILAELKKRYHYANKTKPHATDLLVRALATTATPDAWSALVDKLYDPTASPIVIKEVARALRQLGAKKAVPALREFLLMYRADPSFTADPSPLAAVADTLLALGGAKERELLAYVAEEPRTSDKLANYVRQSLARENRSADEPVIAPAAANGEGTAPAGKQDKTAPKGAPTPSAPQSVPAPQKNE